MSRPVPGAALATVLLVLLLPAGVIAGQPAPATPAELVHAAAADARDAAAAQPRRRDARMPAMLARAQRTLEARWLRDFAGDPMALPGALGWLYEHHTGAGAAQHAARPAAAPVRKAAVAEVPIRVLLRRRADGAPVGGFTAWNDNAASFHAVPADGTLALAAQPGETLWLHLAPDAPVATQRIGVEVHAEQSEYTVLLEDGEVLAVRHAPDSGSLPTSFLTEYHVDGKRHFVRSVPATGEDRVAFAPGARIALHPRPPAPYYLVRETHWLGTARGALLLPFERGASLTLDPAPTAWVTVRRERNRRNFWEGPVNPASPRILVPKDEPVRIHVQPDPPWLPTELRGQLFAGDGVLEPQLQRGVALDVGFEDGSGQPQGMDLAVVAADGFVQTLWGRPSATTVAVPKDAELVIEAAPSSGTMPARVRGAFGADGALALASALPVEVSGTVRNPAGAAQPRVRVEAWQDGERIGSDLSSRSGSYRLSLAEGDYELRWFHEANDAPVLQVQHDTIDVAGTAVTRDLLLPAASGALRLRTPPAGTCAALVAERATVQLQGDGVRPATRLLRIEPDRRSEALSLAPGRYQAHVQLAGFPPQAFAALDVPAGGELEVDLSDLPAGACRRWRGTLRDEDGAPVSAPIVVYDAAQEGIGFVETGADGAFDIPLNDGFLAEFRAPEGGEALRALRMLDRDAAANADVRLQALQWAGGVQAIEGEPQLVYGDPNDPRRLDIVFVAEGYVGAQESFEDANGNGLWDARLFIDLDGNGLWNGYQEPFAVHGEAPWPQEDAFGTDITAGNEAFDDRNGDGYPSIDDLAVFEHNVRNFMRELLSLPFWSERRQQFNAWALWFDSPQAGPDIVDEDGTVVQARATAFDSRLVRGRNLLALDYEAVDAVLAARMPLHGARVVLINQPVPAGRANAFVTYNGGVLAGGRNTRVASHEFGHAIGGLADEYQEFAGNFSGIEPPAPNLTKFDDPVFGKWTRFVQGEPALHAGEAGTGWIDGGGYHQGGVYRPSHDSTMRSNAPLFNAPSLAALRTETCHRIAACVDGTALQSGVWWHPAESGWGLFLFDQGDVLAGAWFTYDDDGEPAWLLVPARPQHDGSYRGEVLRMTGSGFADAAGVDAAQPVGNAELRFAGNGALDFRYTVDGVRQAKSLQPFPFGTGALACRAAGDATRTTAHNASDVWWNPAESGWGLFIFERGEQLFAAWYTYDADREPVFYISVATRTGERRFEGDLLRQRDGTPLLEIDGAPPSDGADVVGRAAFTFTDGSSGEFSVTLDGATHTRPIERLQVGSVASVCEVTEVAGR